MMLYSQSGGLKSSGQMSPKGSPLSGQSPVQGSQSPVQGSQSPVQGSQIDTPVQGSQSPVQGLQSPVKGSPKGSPVHGSQSPLHGSKSAIEKKVEMDSDIEDDGVEVGEECDDSYSDEQPKQSKSPVKKFTQNSYQSGSLVDPNGISFELYSTMGRGDRDFLKQCQYCQKFYNKGIPDMKTNSYKGGMVTYDYDQSGEPICYHCIYMLNYNRENPEVRLNFDGAFGKTIAEFIIECKDSHDKDGCGHPDECFICDYLNGKEIVGIYGSEELFASCSPQPEIKVDSPKNEEISFTICI
jgi:hypothetical protein